MRTIKEHFSDTLILTNSLIVKLIDVAIVMNNGILEKYGIDAGKDLREWKYFLNLAGQKHFSNIDVYIKLLETDEIVPLTKDTLADYPYTNNELLKYGTFYKSLLEEYPSETLYIKGCMSPVDIDTAIAAVDGSILNYSAAYVEAGEYNLIRELQEYIISFLGRWNVKSYVITDELYIPSLLSVLYANIPNAINNLRLAKIYTNEVHSFHMEHFFESNLGIWDDIKILNNKTKYWLYKNLNYLIKHVGKDKVFKTIVNLLNDNNIGVGEYIIRHTDPTLVESNDLSVSGISAKNTILVTSALNQSYTIDNGTVLDLSTVIAKELLLTTATPTTLDNVKEEHLSRIIESQLDSSLHDNEKTKLIDINILKLFDMSPVDPYLVTIDLLTKNVFNKKYNTLIDYTEPNSRATYKVTTKAAYLMLIKQMLFLVGAHEQVIPSIVYTSIPKLNVSYFKKATDKLYKDGYVEDVLAVMLKHLPPELASINNTDMFNTYLANILTYYETVWMLDSNVENTTTSTAIKTVFNRTLDHGTVNLKVGGVALTIDELLLNEGIVYPLADNYDTFASIKEMLLVLTGLNLDKYETINDTISSIRNIINKLTSYTIQVLGNSDDTESTQINYNHVSVVRTSNGLSTVLSGEIDHTLEPYNMVITPEANDFQDRVTVSATPHETQLVIEHPVIEGTADIMLNTDFNLYISSPEVTVSVLPTPTYDVSNNIFIDDFIKGVVGTVYPLDETNITHTTGANDYIVELNSVIINDTTPVIVGMSDVYINGNADATVNDTAIIDAPDTIVTVVPEYVYDISNQTFKDDFLKGVLGTIYPLDETVVNHTTGANDYQDNQRANITNDTNPLIITMSEVYIDGNADASVNDSANIDMPDSVITIDPDYVYDISNQTFKDDFLRGINATIYPLDETKITHTTGANDYQDNQRVNVTNDTNADIILMDPNYIEGYGEMGSTETKITLPDIIVNMVNDNTYDISDEVFVDDFIKGVSAMIETTVAENLITSTSNANGLDSSETAGANAINDTYSEITLEEDLSGVCDGVIQEHDIMIGYDEIVVTLED